jgi:uncharacterized protein (DUF736 family)
MKKNIIWHKVKNEIYHPECHDKLMATLSLFFEDGLPFQSYINFLQDNQEEKFYGNISTMRKQRHIVIIRMNEAIFPNMPPFTATIENMIEILQEYEKLYFLGVDIIEITLEDDTLTIKGDWLHHLSYSEILYRESVSYYTITR